MLLVDRLFVGWPAAAGVAHTPVADMVVGTVADRFGHRSLSL